MSLLSPKRMRDIKTRPIDYSVLAVFLTILGLIPFHSLLTNWAASVWGGELLLKAWPELLLLLALLLTTILMIRDQNIARAIWRPELNRFMIVYAVLHAVVYIVVRPDTAAALVAAAFNLRFFAMFLLARVLVLRFRVVRLRQVAVAIALVGAALVVIFGALQVLVLPNDILTHVGYGFERGQVQPYLTIDENPNYVRINSTLRGPNPLGAYVAVMLLVAGGWLLAKPKRWHWWKLGLFAAAGITLWGSYSRSAWISLGAALLAVGAIWASQHDRYRRWLVKLAVLGLLLLPVGWLGLHQTSFYEHVVLHNNLSDNRPLTSDSGRVNAYKRNLKVVIDNPMGTGPGTAGTASFYNDDVTRISENYYIQIAQEVGITGLFVFLCIIGFVGGQLWRGRRDAVQLGLLGGLIAISIISLFLHGWQDQTLALTWWALAGLFVGAKHGR